MDAQHCGDDADDAGGDGDSTTAARDRRAARNGEVQQGDGAWSGLFGDNRRDEHDNGDGSKFTVRGHVEELFSGGEADRV